jgi:hypothetical protein
MTGSINTEYLNQRMTDLGLTEQQYTFERIWISRGSAKQEDGSIATNDQEQRRIYKIFDCDEVGNIVIHYFNLDGQPYRWKKEDTKQTRDFVRKRLRDPKSDFKYFQEAGSPQFPFFNPGIIDKYKAAKAAVPGTDREMEGKIHTLYLVEGEFKSFKAYTVGVDIVGLPSIHGFYNGDVKGKLHEDLQELIITCKVEKIVFLVDADILSVKWVEGKELSTRPYNFYGSIKAFRESLQLLIDEDAVALQYVYFMHLKAKFINDAKGLDDLLSKYTAVTPEIVEDLHCLQYAKKYFEGYSILDQNKDVHGRIYKYLGLTDEQEFYKTYKDFIGAREFKFKRKRYQFDQEAKEVKFVRHEDADKFMRIGPDWVKVISKVNKHGKKEEELVSWKKSEITSDYKNYPGFLEQCQRYDDFCNHPNFNGEYKRVIEGCYNLCHPLNWTAAEGSIAETISFLKHIFQGKGTVILDDQGRPEKEIAILGDTFTVALDYLTILFKHPKHMLPVPILVSPENGTGKSTFLKWEQAIFQTNMAILGNDQFKMKFNGHYITKYIIAIDEGFLEVDKKAEKERLKQLVTADRAFLENKGMNVRAFDYYGKVQISSNDADRVMKIEDGESRWFVVRVPVAKKKDPDLEAKMFAEIPAFLHFIQNRQIFHPREDRLWFKPEHFITDQFKLIVETTKNRLDRVFEEWIREQFITFRLATLKYPLKYLTEVFNDSKKSKYKVDQIELRSMLHSRGVKSEKRTQRIRIPTSIDIPEDHSIRQAKVLYETIISYPYIFEINDWLKEEEINELQPLTDPTTWAYNEQERPLSFPVQTPLVGGQRVEKAQPEIEYPASWNIDIST